MLAKLENGRLTPAPRMVRSGETGQLCKCIQGYNGTDGKNTRKQRKNYYAE